jgi:hypothetical protein
MKCVLAIVFCALLGGAACGQKMPEGIWEGFDGEWTHVSQQLIALAEVRRRKNFLGGLRREYGRQAKCTCTLWMLIFIC